MNKIMKYLMFFACIFSSLQVYALTIRQEALVKEQVNAVWQKQSRDWSDGDIEAYMQGYWNSKKLRFAWANKITYGYEPTLAGYQKRYHNKDLMGKLTFTPIKITAFSETQALIFGRYRLDYTKDGKPAVDEGLVSTLFEKKQTGWKIISDHTSS